MISSGVFLSLVAAICCRLCCIASCHCHCPFSSLVPLGCNGSTIAPPVHGTESFPIAKRTSSCRRSLRPICAFWWEKAEESSLRPRGPRNSFPAFCGPVRLRVGSIFPLRRRVVVRTTTTKALMTPTQAVVSIVGTLFHFFCNVSQRIRA